MDIGRISEGLTDQSRPTDRSRCVADQASVRLARKYELSNAGQAKRIGQAKQQGEERHHDQRWAKGGAHQNTAFRLAKVRLP